MDDIVKGYEYEKGQFVMLTNEDFAVNLAHFESPHWLEPTKAGRKACVLLREAPEESGVSASARS